MKIGIVGHEAKKFTPEAKEQAISLIQDLLYHPGQEVILVSGGCHLGGIDIWAEEVADKHDPPIQKLIFKPLHLTWGAPGGFKERNLRIAEESDVVHNIVVEKLPPGYQGWKFEKCYHCNSDTHVKSGGCWTAKRAKIGWRHIIHQSTGGVWYVTSVKI